MTQATPVAVIEKFLANTTNPEIVNQLVAPDATYISLNFENKQLKRILPWAGTSKGLRVFVDTFSGVSRYWEILNFQVTDIFSSEEHVAVFGSFTYKSRTLGKTVVSPLSIHTKVKDGKIVYFQFMEDTLATTESFKVTGTAKYHSDPNGSEFEV